MSPRLIPLLLAVAVCGAAGAEPAVYQFDLTADVDAEDSVYLSASIPAGERRTLPINSNFEFEVAAPPTEGMATTVRLIDSSGTEPKVLHTEERDWPASVQRRSMYEICDGKLVDLIWEKENARGGTDSSWDVLGPRTAKCDAYALSRLTRPPAPWRTLSDTSSFLVNVRSAEAVTVYEGLPHQMWEQAAYRHELGRADVFRVEDFPFYASPLKVSQQAKSTLTKVALDGDAHLTYRGPKMCGGYHPDYAVVWERAGNKSGALFCFGCHEVIYFTPQGRLIQELGDSAYGELEAVLSRYRVNRPKTTR